MRKCNKCQVIMNYRGNMKVYLSTGADQLIDKLDLLFASMEGVQVVKLDQYYEVEVADFSVFILSIERKRLFSSVEKKDIFILPLHLECELSFAKYAQTKSLYYWILYFENMDVVEAIENARINVAFQPIFEADTLEVFGHECLARAYDENKISIGADRLFGVSKALGLSFNLDRQCRINAIKASHKTGGKRGKLFINFMPSVIYDPKVCLATTHEIVQELGLLPEDIVFEVVESELVEDYDHLAYILNYYRSHGYKTALDDVGAGYSTLNNYEKLKTDFIKIDMSYILSIHDSPSKQAYLDAVLKIKNDTGVKIIAEGIEHYKDYEYLRKRGVDLVQGYLFAKPQFEYFALESASVEKQ